MRKNMSESRVGGDLGRMEYWVITSCFIGRSVCLEFYPYPEKSARDTAGMDTGKLYAYNLTKWESRQFKIFLFT